MNDIHEMSKELTCSLCTLICGFTDYINLGLENIDTNEAGNVADIIKDLSESIEKLHKAMYYRTLIENKPQTGVEKDELM